MCVCICLYIRVHVCASETFTFSSRPGKVIHSMTGHLDAVSGLAIDPHGLYLLSGGMVVHTSHLTKAPHQSTFTFMCIRWKTCRFFFVLFQVMTVLLDSGV